MRSVVDTQHWQMGTQVWASNQTHTHPLSTKKGEEPSDPVARIFQRNNTKHEETIRYLPPSKPKQGQGYRP